VNPVSQWEVRSAPQESAQPRPAEGSTTSQLMGIQLQKDKVRYTYTRFPSPYRSGDYSVWVLQ